MTDQPGERSETEDDEPIIRTFTTPFGVENDKRKAELEAINFRR